MREKERLLLVLLAVLLEASSVLLVVELPDVSVELSVPLEAEVVELLKEASDVLLVVELSDDASAELLEAAVELLDGVSVVVFEN